jgi:hypothetical protein
MIKGEWSYYKCALLFFIALLIIWVPSSINRVYSLIFPEKASFGLSPVPGVVLPLQGFGTLPSMLISLPACKALLGRLVETAKGGKGATERSDSTSMDGGERNTVRAEEKA